MIETRWGVLRVRVRGEVSRPAVVLSPDPPCVIEHQEALVEELSKDHFVITFEMPGFGFSKSKAGFVYTIEQGAEVIIDLLGYFKVTKAVLALTCITGFSGLRAAKLRPDLVSHLVLGQTPSIDEEKKWVRRVDLRGVLRLPVVGQLLVNALKTRVAETWFRSALPRGADPQALTAIAVRSFKNGARFSLGSGLRSFFNEADSDGLRPSQPLCLIWGLADRTHRSTDKRSLARQLPHSCVVEFKDCGHFPDLERPLEFAKAIRDVKA